MARRGVNLSALQHDSGIGIALICFCCLLVLACAGRATVLATQVEDTPSSAQSGLILTSPNGKHQIHLEATDSGCTISMTGNGVPCAIQTRDGITGIWIGGKDGKDTSVAIYKNQEGPVVGVYGEQKKAMSVALTNSPEGGSIQLLKTTANIPGEAPNLSLQFFRGDARAKWLPLK